MFQIALPPDTEAVLRERANAYGEAPSAYAARLLQGVLNPSIVEETVVPLRKNVEASRTPDEDLDRLRDEIWQEPQSGEAIEGPIIIDRGRGPEIRGTRITVYDVMDYYTEGWNAPQISAVFQLPVNEIEAAIEYIEAHRDEVTRMYQQIIDRHTNYKYPPDVIAKLKKCREKFQALVEKVRHQKREREAEAGYVGDHAR